MSQRRQARVHSAAPREGFVREGELLAGRYIVERIVGRVGIGISLRVRHVDLGQRCLLKYLPQESCVLPETVARFLRGARLALQLSSEHTARTLDAGRLSSGLPYVVTELIEGSDLREVLRARGGISVSEAVDWILQAAEAVAEAHRHGIVHGSLNPSNLLVTQAPDGSPRINVMDFGIAEALRADLLGSSDGADVSAYSATNRRIASLSCTAPEQMRRVTDVEPRTDVWALGALLHEMLTESPVFSAESVTALLAMIVADPPPPLSAMRSDVGAALESVVLRCLEKSPQSRFASVAELAAALKPFASPEARTLADRITRTLGRSARTTLPPQSVPQSSRAMVYVGPPPSPPASVQTPSRFQMMWSTGLVAFGLVGGAIAGALATRGAPERAETVAHVAAAVPATENRVAVASGPVQAEAAPSPPPAPAPSQVPSATLQPVVQPPVAQPPAAAPAPAPLPAAAPHAPVRKADAVKPKRTPPSEPEAQSETALVGERSAAALFDEMR